jgi:hypothetical protein
VVGDLSAEPRRRRGDSRLCATAASASPDVDSSRSYEVLVPLFSPLSPFDFTAEFASVGTR